MSIVDICLTALVCAAALLMMLFLALALLGLLRGRSACKAGCRCAMCRHVERSAEMLYLSMTHSTVDGVPLVTTPSEAGLKALLRGHLAAAAGQVARQVAAEAEAEVREQVAAETRAMVTRFAASCTLGVTEKDLNSLLSYLFLEAGVPMAWDDLADLRRQLAERGTLTVSGTPLTAETQEARDG